ncbi:MAG: tRNA dihydrouridine synthase DusB [Syntrophaceae bacterium]
MKIGDLNLGCGILLAPMAGITDAAFRLMARRTGCDMAVTEMVSAEGLVRNGAKTRKFIEFHPEERPVGVQIFGANAEAMAEAASIVRDGGADLVDINMGCPAKKVTRNGAGSALMKDPRKAARVVEKVRRAIALPLTVKIRAGWNGSLNFIEIGRIAESEGADAVILHPRTVEQVFTGKANWELIAELKRSIKIPVIGNGDVHSDEDACRMLAATGCDGVMVGRGALGNPWLFHCIREKLTGNNEGRCPVPSPEEKKRVAIEHLRAAVLLYGPQAGIRIFWPHLAWYARGLRGASAFRNSIAGIRDTYQMEEIILSFFSVNENIIIESASYQS